MVEQDRDAAAEILLRPVGQSHLRLKVTGKCLDLLDEGPFGIDALRIQPVLGAELGEVPLVKIGHVDDRPLVLAVSLHREDVDDRFQARCLDGVPDRVLDVSTDPVLDVPQEHVSRLSAPSGPRDCRPGCRPVRTCPMASAPSESPGACPCQGPRSESRRIPGYQLDGR